MDFRINQDEIAQKITNEILKEIEESNATFTSDEIREKINNKLDKIFETYESNENKIKQKKSEEDEKIIEKEFTNINESDGFTNKDDKFDSLLESIKLNHDEKEEQTNDDELSNDSQEVETENKKKFLEEFVDLYKNELQNSISGFKNAYESFKLMKKTSIVEKALILVFLAIPAICGGLLTLLAILIILLLWQLHILLNVFIKIFDKVETSIKETIIKIKNKIKILKSSGGFFNRLIFSNALYSLVMFNGMLYMLIKGMVLPLKSAAEIDRILANLASKGVRVISTSLRGPSELALANLKNNALKSGKSVSRGNAIGKSRLNKLKLKGLLKARQNLLKDNRKIVKSAEIAKVMAVKDKIAKHVGAKLQTVKNNLVEQKLNTIGERIDVLKAPASTQLDNSKREKMNKNDLGRSIFEDILRDVKDRIVGRLEEMDLGPLGSLIGENTNDNGRPSNFEDRIRMREDAWQERGEKQVQIERGLDKMDTAAGGPEETKKINDIYNTGGMSISVAINRSDVNMSQEDKFLFAFGKAEENNGKKDFDDTKDFLKFAEQNQNATMLDYREYKVESAKHDREEEEREFAKWYDGKSCKDIFTKAMADCGYDQNTVLNDEQVYEVARHAVLDQDNGFSKDQQVDAMKDLRKYNLTFKEYEACKSELQAERTMSMNKQKESFVEKEENRSNRSNGSRDFTIGDR